MKEMQEMEDSCASASIAYILGLPRESVPNFIKHGENEDAFWQAVDKFLYSWGFQMDKTKSSKGLTLVYGEVEDTPHIYVERDGESVFNTDEPLTKIWGRFKLVPISD